MLIIKIKEGQNGLEKSLKEYKSKVIKTRQMSELNNRKTHKKESIKRRDQIKKAIYIQKKYKNDEQ